MCSLGETKPKKTPLECQPKDLDKMSATFSINGTEFSSGSVEQFEYELASCADESFLEIWVNYERRSLCAMINDDRGWLMFLRFHGDAGFHTENPELAGQDALLTFELSNGQTDELPKYFTYERSTILEGVKFFLSSGHPPKNVYWVNDANDGEAI